MAFIQATAPTVGQNNKILSAGNSIPERHIVMETLRIAAPHLRLKSSVLATLDAMLSCLPPKRNHHTVFASNNTLSFRLNGLSDRTIRRHAATLQEMGLLQRHDSPNRKRYTKRNSHEGKALRFGFDLSPLFTRFQEIAQIAAEVRKEQEQIDYLRAKIRAVANANLTNNPNDETMLNILRILRRKLSLQDCEKILSDITNAEIEAELNIDQFSNTSTIMSANDSQFVRHHHNSNKEHIDKNIINEKDKQDQKITDAPLTVQEILLACPEALEFSLKKIRTTHDIITHARTLAPMIGISNQNYEAAQKRLGALKTAATVWAIMQFHNKIKSVGAYFRSITTGSKSNDFSPENFVRRLAISQKYTTKINNCPRTI